MSSCPRSGRGRVAVVRPRSRLRPAGPAGEQPLRALIDAPAPQAVGNPLAIELALQPGGPGEQAAPRLMARLMRPAARGGWVNGSLTWSGLDSWQVRNGGYRADQLAL